MAVLTAVLLRFWGLEHAPPGLYRDEAWNGLDALRVLDGERALIFPANNGREPLYIYLTALAVSLLGPTTFAVRFSAALVGSLTTLPVYWLGKTWFGAMAGLLSAWLWAITLWPVHLSRLGLRPILFVPLITMAFWLGTLAYRRRAAWLWALAGLCYGLTFYTYLVARFTPVLLLALLLYLGATGRARRLWPGVVWFAAGAGLVLLPLLVALGRDPGLLLGRTGQVSILHPDVNQGSLLITLWRQGWAALGMTVWQGDTILRHNPSGRPVFDWLMVVPFFAGVLWCLWRWRRPAATAVLLWTATMLGPTILAADAPHFLRAVGVLPGLLFLPALGLRELGRALPLSAGGRVAFFALLIGGSLLATVRDYRAYSDDPQVAFAFEKAAADLAAEINGEVPGVDVRLDERFWSGWPSVSFLVEKAQRPLRFSAGADMAPLDVPGAIYAWPYEDLSFVPQLLPQRSLVSVSEGSLARGDLEASAYPLYVRYGVADGTVAASPQALFADLLLLHEAAFQPMEDGGALQVDLWWAGTPPVEADLTAFVHVGGNAGLIGQDDGPLASGRWPAAWWRPGLVLHERRLVPLNEPFDPAQHKVIVGLYDAGSGQRLPVTDAQSGLDAGDAWTVAPE